jgi:hypothetical protein
MKPVAAQVLQKLSNPGHVGFEMQPRSNNPLKELINPEESACGVCEQRF